MDLLGPHARLTEAAVRHLTNSPACLWIYYYSREVVCSTFSLLQKDSYRQTPDHIQALVLLLQGEWQWSERTNGTTPAPHVTPLIAQVLVQREGAGQAVELN